LPFRTDIVVKNVFIYIDKTGLPPLKKGLPLGAVDGTGPARVKKRSGLAGGEVELGDIIEGSNADFGRSGRHPDRNRAAPYAVAAR
jgi:hypothetical protein